MEQLLNAALAIVVGVGAMVFYFWGSNALLDLIFKDNIAPDGTVTSSKEGIREAIRPWLFVAPALIILATFLVFPAIQTLFLSFGDSDGNIALYRPVYPDIVNDLGVGLNAELTADRLNVVQQRMAEEYPVISELTENDIERFAIVEDLVAYVFAQSGLTIKEEFVFFRNYEWAFVSQGSGEFWISVRNNLLWLLVPFLSTVFGLVIAVLADRIRWGAIAKSLIFMPMAISFVGASVIWKFVYDLRPTDSDQIGLLNAVIVGLGGKPEAWIAFEPWNNFFLMVILIWIQTGFAMVLLSAALRGIPDETLEAARIDGANEVQLFFQIMIPQIMSTILVVLTTITITVLKVFDIVLAMTNGQFGTQVLANMMYTQAFRAFHDGRGSAVAMVIMVAVIPILVWNIRQFTQEEMNR
jgi:alpha-glucoside transport system permease protein